jgi:hypothetical protein
MKTNYDRIDQIYDLLAMVSKRKSQKYGRLEYRLTVYLAELKTARGDYWGDPEDYYL